MEAPPKALDKHGDDKRFKNTLKSFSALADFPRLALHPLPNKTTDLQEGTTQHSCSCAQNPRLRQSWGCPQPRGTRMRWLRPGSGMPEATSAEVPVRQHQWSHQRPEVEQEPGPAGADLHPHGRPGARQHLQALVRPETANTRVAPITALHRRGGIPLCVPSTAGSHRAGEGWGL